MYNKHKEKWAKMKIFKRKAYQSLLEWKNEYSNNYACLLEGARRVGKSTLAEEFAKNEFRSYIRVDFSDITQEMLEIFDDIANLNYFFLRLQTMTNVTLYEKESVIIFDEIQLCPKVRQAIKHLVKDGRYFYIETGSLLSIKQNVQNIVIPSEEHKISIHPLDYEEFLWATGENSELLKEVAKKKIPLGDGVNRRLMKSFRLYIAVGGMPQAVNEYIDTNNLERVDKVKSKILSLYNDDLFKIDISGKTSAMFDAIPSQLALQKKYFSISMATKKKKTSKDEERFFNLLNSKMVIPVFNVTQPCFELAQAKQLNKFKLYYSDVGLFVTKLFNNGKGVENDIYNKLLSDRIDANLGYLYENAIAQILTANNLDFYYYTWKDDNDPHIKEIDFLLASHKKVIPIEVKSAYRNNHRSLDVFVNKFSKLVGRRILVSQKDFSNEEVLELIPFYAFPFVASNEF